MCPGCGQVEVAGRGIRYCDDCRPFYADVALARKRARARVRDVKPCKGCGRAKEPGKRRVYCEACRRQRREARPSCQQCRERPIRAKGMRLCVECAAKARERDLRRQREYRAAHPQKPRKGSHTDALSQRMRKRLEAEREGRVLTPVEQVTGGRVASGARVDQDLFPALPSAPLAAAIERLIRRCRMDQNMLAIVADDTPDGTCNVVCERLGLSSRTLYAWQHEGRSRVQFDIVDRTLTRAGWLWFDVYEPCPGDRRHHHDVAMDGRCERCETYCMAEEAFTSERTEMVA